MARTKMKARKGPVAKRIRDLTRLLEHKKDMPADVRVVHERELSNLRNELKAAGEDAERAKMIKKYHMVRFFERQKATRLLKQARKTLASNGNEQNRQELEKEVYNREIDCDYTTHFPLHLAYSSLYKSKEESKDEEETLETHPVNRNHPMWKGVENARKLDKLEQLRDGAFDGGVDAASLRKEKGLASATKKQRHGAGSSIQASTQEELTLSSRTAKSSDDFEMSNNAEINDNGDGFFE